MKAILVGVTMALAFVAAAQARGGGGGGTHEVSGYTRANGTYVAPHESANPGTYSSGILAVPATDDHTVSGYIKKDGTYVAPYHATNPDSTRNDNYSTRGNLNPYTLQPGTKPRDGE